MNLDGSIKRYQAQGWGIQRMDNTGQFVMADEEIREETEDERPHSRACGIYKHNHGRDCAVDCPTCHPGWGAD
jgi:hypothetical protein